MQQLSALDAVFLSMETPQTPGHIGGLATLDPSTAPDGLDFEGFLEFVGSRIPLCPRFAWQLQEVPFGLDLPYWRNDAALDIKRHVHRVAVPAPGGRQELAELAGHLYAKPLDRSLPMWEMYFVEGLQGGRVALLWKIHHCLMDGAAGAGLVEQLFDFAAVPAPREIPDADDSAAAGGSVGITAMLGQALGNAVRRPAALGRHLTTAISAVGQWITDSGLAAFDMAPRVSFNGVVSSQRAIAWSTVSLAEVKDLKNVLGVTLNDVVLTITGSAVRAYLEARGELPEASLVAAVPVSIRQEGDKSIGNQITQVGVTWGTNIADPVERALTIHEATTRAKASAKETPNLLGMLGESFMPGAVQMLARVMGSAADDAVLPSNAVVSNVPMTPVPLYIAGAKIVAMVPLSLLAPTQGLNITVVSYDGELHFGITADPTLVPNANEISGAIPKAVLELQESIAADLATLPAGGLDGHAIAAA